MFEESQVTVSDHLAPILPSWTSLGSHTLTRILSIPHGVSFVKPSTRVVCDISCETLAESCCDYSRWRLPDKSKRRRNTGVVFLVGSFFVEMWEFARGFVDAGDHSSDFVRPEG